MSRKFLKISEVDSQTEGWTVIVQVVEKGHVQIGKSGRRTPYRRHIFTDSEGTLVQATTYGSEVSFFDTRIFPYKRYYISGVQVQPANPQYQISNYAFTWKIRHDSLVEAYPESLPPMLPCTIQLQQYKNLLSFAETENFQNVMGIVVHAIPKSSESKTRDLVIVNEENKPMILTLWSEFASHEGEELAATIPTGNIVIAMRVKVTTFNLLSLTTTYGSGIMINPPVPQAPVLKQWYMDHKEEVAALLEENAYSDPTFLLPPPTEAEIMPIHLALKNLPTVKTTWIRGKTMIVPGQSSYWFTACPNCKKALNAQVGWTVTCTRCNQEGDVEPRCKFTVGIEDNTGVLHAVVSGLEAENLLPMTAAEMSISKDQYKNCLTIQQGFESKTVTCFVRHYISDYQGRDESKFAVVVLYVDEDMNEEQPFVDEHQYTPTGHGVLSALTETPESGPSTLEKTTGATVSAKRSLKFQVASSTCVVPEHEATNNPDYASETGGSKKRRKNNS